MTTLAATVARDVPDAPPELVERVTEATSKELWNLVMDYAERYKKAGNRQAWWILCELASEINRAGVAKHRLD